MEKIFDWGLLLKFKKVYVGCVEAIVCLKIVLKVFIFTLKVLVFGNKFFGTTKSDFFWRPWYKKWKLETTKSVRKVKINEK